MFVCSEQYSDLFLQMSLSPDIYARVDYDWYGIDFYSRNVVNKVDYKDMFISFWEFLDILHMQNDY